MKKTSLAFSLLIFIVIACLSLYSCSQKKKSDTLESTEQSSDRDYAALILELQDKLESMKEEQNADDIENGKKLDELKNTIESLRAETESQSKESESEDTAPSHIEPHFTYATEGNSATITGYTGNDESLVIPSYIDGYKVVNIADSAFSSQALKRVIISDGIENIGWFAFYACPSLSSVTIPSSVKSIGHSAFSSTAKFTIYCHEASFAHKFAKSYGIDYALI